MINNEVIFGSVLEEYYSNGTNNSIKVVIAPFITISTIEKILKDSKNVIILTSWRLDHLRSGVSSLELYEICRKNDWKLFINDRLHAKIYCNNYENCFIGSANVTDRALYDLDGNVESLVFVEPIPPQDVIQIQRLIYQSVLVDDDVYDQYKSVMGDVTLNVMDDKSLDIDVDVPLHISLLPALDDPFLLLNPEHSHLDEKILHDLALYTSCTSSNLQNALYDIQSCFIKNPFVKKIEPLITEKGLSFGELSHIIHTNCVDVPTPYRSNIKIVTKNLLNWFCSLFPDVYEVRVPNRHSQVLFRR